MHSWFPIPPASDFSPHNLPFGIFDTGAAPARAGVAVGAHILDLGAAATLDVFAGIDVPPTVFASDSLNAFIALGKGVTGAVRRRLQDILTREDAALRDHPDVFVRQSDARMHLPVHVGDYTDFYSSIEHATNVGKMFRDPDNALLPNWRHIPVGYHGRASSIVVSGTPIRRPYGQVLPPGAEMPVFQATRRLDFELEMAFVIGRDSTLGTPVSIADAEAHIFGLVLFNDWSARDIQKWEYVPLGPFLGKNFASSVSPWIVPLEAFAPFRVAGPEQQPPVLPYLQTDGRHNLDITLEVAIAPENGEETMVSQTNFRHMYWSMAQQLAHHTVNGCNVRVGDMMASGTISGPSPSSYGSMLELAWAGQRPLTLADGSSRTFIEDGDTVIMRGAAGSGAERVGFGDLRTTVRPAEVR